MSARRGAALLLATVALAGCGEKPEPDVSKPTAVTGTVDLARPAPANPDAGTTAGHRAPDATATHAPLGARVHRPREPPSSRVTLAPAGGQPAAVGRSAPTGASARGRASSSAAPTASCSRARSPGLRPWTVDVSITRR